MNSNFQNVQYLSLDQLGKSQNVCPEITNILNSKYYLSIKIKLFPFKKIKQI